MLKKNDIESPGDLFGVLKYLFKDEFYFSRPFISSNDVGEMSRKNVLLAHLEGISSIKLDDINDLCESAGIYLYNKNDAIRILQPEYVRTDKNTLMSAASVGISEDVVFKTADIVRTDIEVFTFLPCNNIDDFSWYPDINIEWNPFIVESIITGMCNDEIAFIRIPSGGSSAISNVVFVSEKFADDDYQSFILKVLKKEHENNPFSSRQGILDWLIDKGLCKKKLPSFLADETYLYCDENNKLQFR